MYGQSDQLFIAANPKFKAISAFDQNGKVIPQNALEKRYSLGPKTSELSIIGKAATSAPLEKKEKVKVVKMSSGGSGEKEKSKPQNQSAGEGLTKKKSGKGKGMHP